MTTECWYALGPEISSLVGMKRSWPVVCGKSFVSFLSPTFLPQKSLSEYYYFAVQKIFFKDSTIRNLEFNVDKTTNLRITND